MLLRPYNAVGALTAPLSKRAYVMTIDETLANLLDIHDGEDWCYLYITYDSNIEVVKVVGKQDSTVAIVRAQDNTIAIDFPAGAIVQHVLTAAEIRDSVLKTNVDIYSYEALEYDGKEVQYSDFNIQWVGVNYTVGEGSSQVAIGRKENAYGCCNGNNEPVPIGGPIFYLTTTLYPIQVVESISSKAVRYLVAKMLGTVEDALTSSADVVIADLYGGLVQTSSEEAITSSADVVNADLYGGIVAFDTEEEAITSQCAVLQGHLYGNLVVYIAPVEALVSDCDIVSGELI